jgi:hypothetical protein
VIALLGYWDDEVSPYLVSVDLLDSVEDYKVIGAHGCDIVKNRNNMYKKYVWL